MTTADRFHDRTRLAPDRGVRGPMDWRNRPDPFKRYAGLDRLLLPVDLPRSEVPAPIVLSGRRTGTAMPLDLAGMARLLFFAAGITRRARRAGHTSHFRAAPSAGALYPIELYVTCADLADLPAGAYHFSPLDFALRRLRSDDVRGRLAAAAADPAPGRAPLTVVLTGIPWRTTWKYGPRGYRHLFWDAGVILAHLLALADAAGLATRLLTGFVDEAVGRLLGLEAEEEATGGELPLALLSIGDAEKAAADPGPLPRLRAGVEALSPAVPRDEDLRAVHHAGDLGEDDVAGWREAMSGFAPAGAAPQVEPPSDPGEEAVEAVILRRGSTRSFGHDPVDRQVLDWGLAVAQQAPPWDAGAPGAAPVRPFTSVHAVSGAAQGIYAWQPEDASPQGPRRRGDTDRRETAFLCLGQGLGGDAAFTAFLCTGLRAWLDTGGDRAYRAAQLAGGIAAGRLQLAAFARGCGATGLTFFDEEVRGAYGTGREPMTCVAVGMPDYPPWLGRTPAALPPER